MAVGVVGEFCLVGYVASVPERPLLSVPTKFLALSYVRLGFISTVRLPATRLFLMALMTIPLSALVKRWILGALLRLVWRPSLLAYVKTEVTGPAEAPLFPS